MGFLIDAVKTFQLLATTIALLSVHNLSTVNYTPSHKNSLECGFSQDFKDFLRINNYSEYNFTRPDVKCGCFGGKNYKDQALEKTPIVFIHGSSDIAFGGGTIDGYLPWQTGFRSLATYFDEKGWNKSELYTTTWGQVDPAKSQQNYHSKKAVLYLRAFIQAVIQYTKAKQIILIGHSMGATLARKVIKGGKATDHIEGEYDVGQNITSKIKAFIVLGGANLGLVSCYEKTSYPTCNQIDGMFPGYLPNSGPSKFLEELNKNEIPEGKNIYTIWSRYDDLVGYDGQVWGNLTSRIPSQTDEIVKDTTQWGHFYLRDNVGPDILNWIKE